MSNYERFKLIKSFIIKSFFPAVHVPKLIAWTLKPLPRPHSSVFEKRDVTTTYYYYNVVI